MAGIVAQRNSLHQQLFDQQQLNQKLRSQIDELGALANIGMVSAMVAHEINNILTPIGCYAQLAMSNPDDKDLTAKTLEKAAANSERAAKIFETMLSIANGKEQKMQLCDLKKLTEDVFTCIARDFSKDKINVKINIEDNFMIPAQPISLQQVLMNLILNARAAMLDRGGTLTISAEQALDSIKITVTDTGCGIEKENLMEIFEPFYTTKTQDSKSLCVGAGLGLAFCKKIVDSHKGVISVESEPGSGTVFRIILPSRQ